MMQRIVTDKYRNGNTARENTTDDVPYSGTIVAPYVVWDNFGVDFVIQLPGMWVKEIRNILEETEEINNNILFTE